MTMNDQEHKIKETRVQGLNRQVLDHWSRAFRELNELQEDLSAEFEMSVKKMKWSLLKGQQEIESWLKKEGPQQEDNEWVQWVQWTIECDLPIHAKVLLKQEMKARNKTYQEIIQDWDSKLRWVETVGPKCWNAIKQENPKDWAKLCKTWIEHGTRGKYGWLLMWKEYGIGVRDRKIPLKKDAQEWLQQWNEAELINWMEYQKWRSDLGKVSEIENSESLTSHFWANKLLDDLGQHQKVPFNTILKGVRKVMEGKMWRESLAGYMGSSVEAEWMEFCLNPKNHGQRDNLRFDEEYGDSLWDAWVQEKQKIYTTLSQQEIEHDEIQEMKQVEGWFEQGSYDAVRRWFSSHKKQVNLKHWRSRGSAEMKTWKQDIELRSELRTEWYKWWTIRDSKKIVLKEVNLVREWLQQKPWNEGWIEYRPNIVGKRYLSQKALQKIVDSEFNFNHDLKMAVKEIVFGNHEGKGYENAIEWAMVFALGLKKDDPIQGIEKWKKIVEKLVRPLSEEDRDRWYEEIQAAINQKDFEKALNQTAITHQMSAKLKRI